MDDTLKFTLKKNVSSNLQSSGTINYCADVTLNLLLLEASHSFFMYLWSEILGEERFYINALHQVSKNIV